MQDKAKEIQGHSVEISFKYKVYIGICFVGMLRGWIYKALGVKIDGLRYKLQ